MDLNSLMKPTYERLISNGETVELPRELQAIADGGLVSAGTRIYLASPENKRAPLLRFDEYEAERWVNKIHLGSDKPPDDPSWRVELLGFGLKLARRLLAHADGLTTLPVQVTVSLQSAEGSADPDIDFATGALHLYLVRSTRDDAGQVVEDYAQPLAVLTSR